MAKIVVLFSALTVLFSMGIRQSFGLFLQPISQDLELGREVFSLAMALQNLIFGLPLLGMVADRYGPRWVILRGALLYAAGCLLVPGVQWLISHGGWQATFPLIAARSGQLPCWPLDSRATPVLGRQSMPTHRRPRKRCSKC